jgi:hypothetical protein
MPRRDRQVAARQTGQTTGGPAESCITWRPSRKRLGCVTMAEIVQRVRLIGGDHVDVTYGDRDAAEDEVVKYVISTLAEDGGTLRCKHGDRLIVLYGRGVATIEIAPRGAVL